MTVVIDRLSGVSQIVGCPGPDAVALCPPGDAVVRSPSRLMVRVVALAWALVLCVCGEDERGFLNFELNNGRDLPVVGLGIGNLAHRSIPSVVESAVVDQGVRLIDTAMASNNEHLLQETLRRLPAAAASPVQIVTKVWYTHLGYGRTKLAVEESLKTLGSGAEVTVLIHWPFCRDDVPWMRCEEEEQETELRFRQAGPPPHLDRSSWRGSWKALEELYESGRVKNIGVSNFDADDVRALLADCSVVPQLYQGNVWSALFDPALMDLLASHHILFQAYNVMNGILADDRRAAAPNAYRELKALARHVRAPLSAVVLKALSQRDIATIPRASTDAHLAANQPAAGPQGVQNG